jgi:hypothetical protein
MRLGRNTGNNFTVIQLKHHLQVRRILYDLDLA